MKTLLIISIAWLSTFSTLRTVSPLDDRLLGNGALIETETTADTVPRVFNAGHGDLIAMNLRHQAALKFTTHHLPTHPDKWKTERARIKNEIVKKAGIVIDKKLPLNYQETGVSKMEGFTVKNIIFQTRPGVYATANL